MTLLADLVAASQRVAGTSSRSQKIAILAELLRAARAGRGRRSRSGFLSGVPRQGRVGVGYATVYGDRAATPAAEPSLDDRRPRRARSREIQGDDRQPAPAGAAPASSSPSCSAARPRPEAELRPPAAHRRAAAGRARRADGRRGREGGGRAGGARAPRAHALRRPPADGRARADRGRGRACAASASSSSGRSSRCSPRRPRPSPRRSRASSAPSVEWKLDGIRIQIHRRGDEVRIYTRNLNEITASLPGIVEAVRRAAGDAGGARRRGAVDGRGRAGRVPGHGRAARRATRRPRGRDVPLRPAARRRRGPARHAARASAPRGSRRSRRS